MLLSNVERFAVFGHRTWIAAELNEVKFRFVCWLLNEHADEMERSKQVLT